MYGNFPVSSELGNVSCLYIFYYFFLFYFFQGLDQLRSGILQQQKSFMQSPQQVQQLQFLSPHQQQLLLQTQQNLASPSAGDVDGRRLRMLLNNRNMLLGKDGRSNNVGDVIPNVGSPMQTPCPVMPRADTDMLIKVQL